MNAEQIKAGLLSLDESHDFYRAVLALLENEIGEEMDGVTAPDLTEGARHFNAGRLARARDTLNVIRGLRTAAAAERAEREERDRKNAEARRDAEGR